MTNRQQDSMEARERRYADEDNKLSETSSPDIIPLSSVIAELRAMVPFVRPDPNMPTSACIRVNKDETSALSFCQVMLRQSALM